MFVIIQPVLLVYIKTSIMKKNTFILIFLFCMATAKGQEPAITMTTAKAVGETISFSLAASADNTTIQVDFGDGIKVDETIGTSPININGTLVGSQTIKIYGQGVISIDCSFNQLTTLDVSNNAALTDLYCNNNKLTTLDVSNNIALTRLYCHYNPLTTLDVSNNTALIYLSCHNNQLTTLDVSNNTALIFLYCNHNQLTTLDVSNNTALTYLWCSFNQLTILDVSNNTTLTALHCTNNHLSYLDVSNNTALTTLWCFGNQLTFATLPFNHSAWSNFNYVGQKPIFIGKEVKVGDETDLSSQLTVNGNTTVYTWKTKDGTTLTDGVDYTITNGKTVFLKSQADSVYCEMTNATFPRFTGKNALKTSLVKVHPATASSEPSKAGNGLYIYPNPAKNLLNIVVLGVQNAELSIYNALGMLMLQQSIDDREAQVHIGHLPKGVYMLQITNGNRKLVQKIMKE